MGIGMQYVTGIRYETENVICNGDQNVICSLHSDPHYIPIPRVIFETGIGM